MAQLFAWVEFSDGRKLYGQFSTVVDCFLSPLYESYAEPGTILHGQVVRHPTCVGEPILVRWDRPLSPPEEMISVKVFVERDYRPWHALYCPSQRKVWPEAARNAAHLQEYMELVEQDGLRHLVPRLWKVEGYFGDEIDSATLCGKPVTGSILPFQRDQYDFRPGPHPEKPPQRDLYAEWDRGGVCKHCLVDKRALNAINEPERHAAAHPRAAPEPPPARRSFWRRFFG